MSDTMQFDLVSPERSLASLVATSVQIPGSEGDMTAMADHAPILTTLRPGILAVNSSEGLQEFVVTGGFAEVTSAGVTVLAERAIAKSDVTQDDYNQILAAATTAAEGAGEGAKDAASKTHADTVALADVLSLTAQ